MSTNTGSRQKALFSLSRHLTPSTRQLRWFAAAVLLAGTSVGACQAAEKIRYDEIPKQIAPFGSVLEYRGFNVITLDGAEHRGRRLGIESDHVRIFYRHSWQDFTSEQILRIQITQHGRFFHRVVPSALFPLVLAGIACGEDGIWGDAAASVGLPVCITAVTALFSPAWAYTAAIAPFFLVSDGVALFIPPKVYEIIH